MTNSLEENAEQSSSPTPKDVVAYIRGDATPEQDRLVRAALKDPNSQVNEWLQGVEKWAKEAFPPTGRVTDAPENNSIIRLDAVLEFVHQKRIEKVLTEEDIAHITSEGGLSGTEPFPTTPAQAIAATSRIIAAINELHPELAAETAKLGSGRSR